MVNGPESRPSLKTVTHEFFKAQVPQPIRKHLQITLLRLALAGSTAGAGGVALNHFNANADLVSAASSCTVEVRNLSKDFIDINGNGEFDRGIDTEGRIIPGVSLSYFRGGILLTTDTTDGNGRANTRVVAECNALDGTALQLREKAVVSDGTTIEGDLPAIPHNNFQPLTTWIKRRASTITATATATPAAFPTPLPADADRSALQARIDQLDRDLRSARDEKDRTQRDLDEERRARGSLQIDLEDERRAKESAERDRDSERRARESAEIERDRFLRDGGGVLSSSERDRLTRERDDAVRDRNFWILATIAVGVVGLGAAAIAGLGANRFRSEREVVRTERDTVTTARNTLIGERDRAIEERNAARVERDNAFVERDAVRTELNNLIAERNNLIRVRDTFQAERDAVRRELDAALADRDEAIRERDTSRGELVAARRELDDLRAELANPRPKIATLRRIMGRIRI